MPLSPLQAAILCFKSGGKNAAIKAYVAFITTMYFESITVRARGNLPKGNCILACNHASGLVDPMVLLTAFPNRRVASIAKHSLFTAPVVGWFLKRMDAIPVAQPHDIGLKTQVSAEQRAAMNAAMFSAVIDKLASGWDVCIFPEGTTHSGPELKELRSGSAKLALMAQEATQKDGNGIPVVPIGLFYRSSGAEFRSTVVVHVGAAIYPRKGAAPDSPSDVLELTERIGRGLHSVTALLPDWTTELRRLCLKRTQQEPVYKLVQEPTDKPNLKYHCVVSVGDLAIESSSHTESSRELKHRIAKGFTSIDEDSPPLFLRRQAARRAFFSLTGLDYLGDTTDEEIFESIRLARHLYRPSDVQLFPAEMHALAQNFIDGFFHSNALADSTFRALFAEILAYHRVLASLGIKDWAVPGGSHSTMHKISDVRARIDAVRSALIAITLLPVSAIGTILHGPIAGLCLVVGSRFGTSSDGDLSTVATMRVITAVVCCLSMYVIICLAVTWVTHSPILGLLTATAAAFSGYVALIYSPISSWYNKIKKSMRNASLSKEAIDSLVVTRQGLVRRLRALVDAHGPPETRGWWRDPVAFRKRLEDRKLFNLSETADWIVSPQALQNAPLTEYSISLSRNLRSPEERAVLTVATRPGNDKAILWIPGMNDSFYHVHMLEPLLSAGFNLFAIDLRRCGRARFNSVGDSITEEEDAHDTHDLQEYFEEIDAALQFIRNPDPLPEDGVVQHGGCGVPHHRKIVVFAHSVGALVAAQYEKTGAWRGCIDGYLFNSPLWDLNLPWYADVYHKATKILGSSRVPNSTVLAAGGEPNGYSRALARHYAFHAGLKSIRTLNITAGWYNTVVHAQTLLRQKELIIHKPVLVLFEVQPGEEQKQKGKDGAVNKTDCLNDLLDPHGLDGRKQPLSHPHLVERTIFPTASATDEFTHDVFAAPSPEAVKEAVDITLDWLRAQFGIISNERPFDNDVPPEKDVPRFS